MKDLKEKTKEFSKTILETKEFKEYDRVNKEFRDDEKTFKLFNDFQKARNELSILEHGNFDGIEKQRDRVEKLFSEVKENEKINNWIKSQKEFQKLINQIAVELSNELKFPFTLPQQGCSGGCNC